MLLASKSTAVRLATEVFVMTIRVWPVDDWSAREDKFSWAFQGEDDWGVEYWLSSMDDVMIRDRESNESYIIGKGDNPHVMKIMDGVRRQSEPQIPLAKRVASR